MKTVVKCGSCGGTLRTLRTKSVYGAVQEEQVFVNACVVCADRKYEEGKADGRLEEREKETVTAPAEDAEEPDLTVTPLDLG